MKVPRSALALALVLAGWVGAAQARAAGEIKPGAYCPLPKMGETPRCLEPAMAEYEEFFSALSEGEMDTLHLARVESDVAAGAASETAYLALSSLAYGYYRLSQRAAEAEGIDPRVVARLERWNALLATAYEASAADAEYRRAVREAALDLQRRAPPVRLRCLDEGGETVECDSTDAVMRGIDAAAREVGIRGALARLLERILGPERR